MFADCTIQHQKGGDIYVFVEKEILVFIVHSSRAGTFIFLPKRIDIFSSSYIHINICFGYSLKVTHQGSSNVYPQHMILWTCTVAQMVGLVDREVAGLIRVIPKTLKMELAAPLLGLQH